MDEGLRELLNSGRKIDNGIQELTKSWESPHLLIGGYGQNVEEASPFVERFLGEIKDLQDQVIKDRESQSNHMINTERDINRVEDAYKYLKQQCDDVESMLSEFGYQPMRDASECPSTDESETESSILTASQMEHSRSLCSDVSNGPNVYSDRTPTINGNRDEL